MLTIATTLFLVAGYAAVATSSHMRPPTVVVTFDLDKVRGDLTERADAIAKIEALVNKISDEMQKKVEKIKQIDESLKSASDADREILEEEGNQLILELNSYQRFADAQIDIERSLMYRDLYLKIQEAVNEIADENGYDLVLISDNTRKIGVNPELDIPREYQVREQIRQKRIMFASSQIDITEQIVTHMNIAWEKKSTE
jgi:Skp family chaperone for outer membrane proteins